jgi:hypothetical protein
MSKSLKIKLIGMPGEPVITGRHVPFLTSEKVAADVIIQPGFKFFTYDNGNNEPIYDENTGEQLRDPVTGEPI